MATFGTRTRFSRTAARSGSSDIAIAGFQRAGLLDWPGKVTATVFVAGCSLACPYCHNPELVAAPRRTEDMSAFIAHVRERRNWLDGVVVTGGEPCLNEGALLALLELLKSEGMPVKLDTNGTFPETLALAIREGLVDYVALDIKATPERYTRATGVTGVWERVARSVATIMDSGVDHEFRTTCYPLAVGPEDPVRIASTLVGGSRYVLQQFRPHKTLDPAAISVRPHTAETLQSVSQRCSAYLPTVVRGAS